jgi:hypothetical protein
MAPPGNIEPDLPGSFNRDKIALIPRRTGGTTLQSFAYLGSLKCKTVRQSLLSSLSRLH